LMFLKNLFSFLNTFRYLISFDLFFVWLQSIREVFYFLSLRIVSLLDSYLLFSPQIKHSFRRLNITLQICFNSLLLLLHLSEMLRFQFLNRVHCSALIFIHVFVPCCIELQKSGMLQWINRQNLSFLLTE